MTSTSNAARRLHWVLSTLADYQSMPLAEGIARTMNRERQEPNLVQWPKDRAAIIRELANMVRLGEIVIQGVDGLSSRDEEAQAQLEFFGEVQEAINHLASALSSQEFLTHQVTSNLTPPGLHSLVLAGYLFERHFSETKAEIEDLTTLLPQLRELVDAIAASEELSPSARRSLVAHLRAVEDAILDIRINGYEGVAHAADGLVGGIVRDHQHLARLRSSPKWSMLMGVLTALNLALTAAQAAHQLGSGDPPPPRVVVNEIVQAVCTPPAALPPPSNHQP